MDWPTEKGRKHRRKVECWHAPSVEASGICVHSVRGSIASWMNLEIALENYGFMPLFLTIFAAVGSNGDETLAPPAAEILRRAGETLYQHGSGWAWPVWMMWHSPCMSRYV